MTVSVVLPTLNERENVKEVLGRVQMALGKSLLEVILVDDASTDGTCEAAEESDVPSLRLIRREGERGLGSAIARGIQECRGDAVVWLDCDLGIPPEAIPSVLAKLKECDVAVGSRYVGLGKDTRSWPRAMASVLINRYANLLLGLGVRDATSGFAAVKREVFERLKFPDRGFGEYFVEFLFLARREGFSIAEVGYRFGYRKGGVSKLDSNFFTFCRHGFSYAFNIAKIRRAGR